MKITDLKKTWITIGAVISSGVMAVDESDLPIGVKHNENLEPVQTVKALVDGSAGSGGTSIRYKNFAASGMKPIYGPQTYEFEYSGGGCMKAVAPTTYLGLDEIIDIPVGSKIVSMTFLANPTSSTDQLNGLLFTTDASGSFNTVAFESIQDAGISSHTSVGTFLDYTTEYDTMVMARIEQTSGNTAEICGIRIGYISYDVANDVIFSSNFYR